MMNVSQRLESLPMTPTMKKILVLVGIGWLFDAMDQGMVSGVIAAIGTDWALTPLQLSWLGSAGVLGMIVGAALSGAVADRWGRRKVVMATLLIYSVGSALSGLAPNYMILIICRFITGFGLGGELPAASTLVSEFSPLKSRGRNVVLLESFWAWGWIAASLVAYFAIPLYGWRVAFLIGAIPALFAAVLRRMVPESPLYLESKGRFKEADALVCAMEKEAGIARPSTSDTEVPEAKLHPGPSSVSSAAKPSFARLWSQGNRRTTAVLWIIWFGVNFGYYGFVLWTPTLLMGQGFDMVKSFGFTVIMCLAQLPGYFSAAYLIEKLGRKPVLICYFAGTAVAAWLFGQAGSEAAVLAAGCLLYFFALGAWGCVYAYTPEAYPTEVRASGAGWAAAFGRIGAFVAPFIVPALYAACGAQNGFAAVFALLAAAFAAVSLVVALFGRETKDVPLVSSERRQPSDC